MILDLDGTAPPPLPKSVRWPVVGVRMPSHLKRWAEDRARADNCSLNAFLVRTLTAARDTPAMPADVRDWLTIQAAQCGVPGDPDAALAIVVRHLAGRWPDGARLNP